MSNSYMVHLAMNTPVWNAYCVNLLFIASDMITKPLNTNVYPTPICHSSSSNNSFLMKAIMIWIIYNCRFIVLNAFMLYTFVVRWHTILLFTVIYMHTVSLLVVYLFDCLFLLYSCVLSSYTRHNAAAVAVLPRISDIFMCRLVLLRL